MIKSRRGEGSRGRVRSGRVAGYAADLGDVFQGAGVGGLDDELLAEGAEASFRARCHSEFAKALMSRQSSSDNIVSSKKTLKNVGKRWHKC